MPGVIRPDLAEPQMAEADAAVILAFARGDLSLRDAAIAIHRASIPALGVRGTREQRFMAEVDNPSSDAGLRMRYRLELLKGSDP